MNNKKINLDGLEGYEVIALYSEILKTLKSRKIIRTNNLVGELGEYLVIDHFNKTPNLPNLILAEQGTQNIDAISRQGKRYAIKSVSSKTTGVFYGLNPPEEKESDEKIFDYVVIIIFDENYQMEKIIQLDWSQFLIFKRWNKTMKAWNLSITRKLIDAGKIIYSRDL